MPWAIFTQRPFGLWVRLFLAGRGEGICFKNGWSDMLKRSINKLYIRGDKRNSVTLKGMSRLIYRVIISMTGSLL